MRQTPYFLNIFKESALLNAQRGTLRYYRFPCTKRTSCLSRTATGQRTFYFRTVNLWNSLDPTLKMNQNLTDFKRCLKKSLLSKFGGSWTFYFVVYAFSRYSGFFHLRWLTTVFSGERVPCFNLARNVKRGFLLDCFSL